jgi:hypothetical protein
LLGLQEFVKTVEICQMIDAVKCIQKGSKDHWNIRGLLVIIVGNCQNYDKLGIYDNYSGYKAYGK